MRCVICKDHATFEHTVFKGTEPVKVRLCDACASKVEAEKHLSLIKDAPDHSAKNAAVEGFLKIVGV